VGEDKEREEESKGEQGKEKKKGGHRLLTLVCLHMTGNNRYDPFGTGNVR